MFRIKYDLIDPQFLVSLVFSYHQLVGGVQNTAIQGKKMFIFFHNASFFGSCLFNNQNQTLFFAGLGSGYQFRIHSDLINWTTEKILEQN